ncbi:MAG: TRAP transporter substrate-binding protein DctP [Acidobacteriota bacterium]|nr:TRAP transporter substrate-binding protein DctP [Acidobacteriota bacterium]
MNTARPLLRFLPLILIAAFVTLAARPVAGAGFAVKMATLSPDGSPWDGFFETMGRDWIFTWAGDEAMTSWWREGGFKPVALAATDIVTGLQTGMIDALAVPPIYAMQVQFFKQARYFADIPLIPMMGAIVVTKRAWNRISEEDRDVMIAAGQRAEKSIFETIPTLEQTAIRLMGGQGLEVVPIVGSEVEDNWVEIANDFAASMRGRTVPEAIFDRAEAVRDAYRRQSSVD